MNKNILTNFKEVKVKNQDGSVKKACVPKPMPEMVKETQSLLKGWPKVCGGEPFYHDWKSGTKVDYITNAAALLGLVGSLTGCPSKFLGFPGYHKPAEFFNELVRTGESYEAIEKLPHEPKMPDTYYACDIPEPGNGESLLGLVKRFNPATKADEDLILAAIVTLFWGGHGGQRPAFLITSDYGRGAGKTQFVLMLAHLVGGAILIDPNENIETTKQRLLSSEAMGKRVGLYDNIKSKKFSSAGIESQITASTISGKKMYKGEHSRPNTIVFFFTVNGAGLSKDLAQRCIIIKLDKAKYSSNWESGTRKYIDDHREKIIADIIAHLRRDAQQLRTVSRWGAWEGEVIARGEQPEEVQKLIRERQQTTDVDQEETQIIEDYFREKLSDYHYSTDTDKVYIPSKVATNWFNEATNERLSTIKVSRSLKQGIDEGSFDCIQGNTCKSYGRGFVWVGQQWDCISSVRLDLEHQIEINRKFN